MTRPTTRRRDKLAPDPDVRRAILAAASKSVREHGVRGLSISAVLDRAGLSTRAFYRHFESKDHLVAAVFLEMARAEKRRLRRRMAEAATPVEAVAARGGGRPRPAFAGNNKYRLPPVFPASPNTEVSSPPARQPAYTATRRHP